MGLISELISHFKKPEEETCETAPDGVCPLCWGHQEYDHKIRKVFKDKQVDVNNHRDSYLLIQDFVVNNIEGIRLKDGEETSCPTCSEKLDNNDKCPLCE